MNYRRLSHCVYGLEYHIVLVTKYRREVITGEVDRILKEECKKQIDLTGGKVIEIESDLDHIHILTELPPNIAVSEAVRRLKYATSRVIRNRCNDLLKDKLWGDNFWSESYFISSTGGITMDIIKNYVANQGKRPHGGRPRKADSSPLESRIQTGSSRRS